MPRKKGPLLLASSLLLATGCSELSASPDPMGEPIELGEACEQTPVATGTAPGQVVPNIVSTDQYGETIDLYVDLCDRHVLIVRAGFD